MNSEFSYLLSVIVVYDDLELGPSIKLIDFEHLDYIDDVLSEIFEIDHTQSTTDDKNRKFILHFEDKVTSKKLKEVVEEINIHHMNGGEPYKTKFNNSFS